MQNFIPGLKLSELFYTEAGKPILETFFPQIPHSAALLGWGSEVLGYDDVQSSIITGGPRFLLFLSPEHYQEHKSAIAKALSDNLPHRSEVTQPILEILMKLACGFPKRPK